MDNSSNVNPSHSWSMSSGSHTKGDLLYVQELKMQNEHFRQTIDRLQASLDSANLQLQSALSTAGQVGSLHEEIHSLRNQLTVTQENNSRMKKALKQQVIEISTKAEEEKALLTKTNEEQQSELTKLSTQLLKIQEERDSLKTQCNTAKSELMITAEQLAKVTKQRQRSRERNRELNDQLNELSDKYNSLSSAQEQLAFENRDQAEKISSLTDELASVRKSLSITKENYFQKKKEYDECILSIDSLNNQLLVQKEDISDLNSERTKLLSLVQRLNSIVLSFEEQIDVLKSENEALLNKAKKAYAMTPSLFADKFNIKDVTFPFEGNLKQRIECIAGYDHFQPTQSVQIIINEISKSYHQILEENSELSKNANESKSRMEECVYRYQKTYNLLNSILREWKNLEFNENKIDTVAFCDSDPTFLTFLAEQCVRLDKLPEAAQFLGNLFVPTEIFNEEHFEERKAIVDEAAATNKDLSALMSALFLINTRLKKEVSKLSESCETKATITGLLNSLGCEDIQSVPKFVEDLQNRVNHLKSTRKEVHGALVQARDSIAAKHRDECALHRQIENLKKQINEYISENATLKAEVELLRNQANQFKEELVASPSIQLSDMPNVKLSPHTNCATFCNISGLQDKDTSEMKHTIKSLQKDLSEKTRECEQLRTTISQLQSENNRNQAVVAQEAQEIQKAQNARIKELQENLNRAEEKLAKTRKKAKTFIKDLKGQHETEIAAANQDFHNIKADLNESINESRHKLEKACALIKQLQENLDESDRKCSNLTEDNNRLLNNVKSLENKINSMLDQNKKDQKQTQADIAAKILSIEGQHKKDLKDLKSKFEGEKKSVIDFFTTRLGSLYGIADLDFDEISLGQLFGRIQSDLCKLRFFQEQATKICT